MRKLYPFSLLCLALIALACGGGGGGGGNGGGGFVLTRIEAVEDSSPQQPIDPTNIQSDDNVQFELVGYRANGTREIIDTSAETWSTTDTTNQAGVFTTAGNLDANAASPPAGYVASVTVGSTTYNVTYVVTANRPIVTGLIHDSNTQAGDETPMAGIVVEFFNSAGTKVGQAISAYNGFFRASVPTTADELNFVPSSIPNATHYRSFAHGANRFTPLDPTCGKPLPVLSGTNTYSMSPPTFLIDARVNGNGVPQPPPPPPDGCFL